MDTDARGRRQELERIAFGRTHGRQDEVAAAAARKELAEAARAVQATAPDLEAMHHVETPLPVLAVGLGPVEPPSGATVLPPPPPPERRWKVVHRIRPAWLLPIIAASIAVGYYGTSIAAAGAFQEPVLLTGPIVPSPVFLSPTPEPPPIDGVSAGQPSSLKEADAWFETLPRESDAVPDPAGLQGLEIDPSAIRFVQIDATGLQVWVARKLDGDLCLLATGGGEEGASAFTGCSSREVFARSGVTLSLDQYSMSWNGSSVTVSTSKQVVAP